MANPWGQQISDEFGELLEQGKKQTTQVAKTITTGVVKKTIEELTGIGRGQEELEKLNKQVGLKYTKLPLKDLEDKYKLQDAKKLDDLRGRLFQLVKGDEKHASDEAKKEEQEKKQQEAELEEQKKQEKIKAEQSQDTLQVSSKTKRGQATQKVKKAPTLEKKDTGKQ